MNVSSTEGFFLWSGSGLLHVYFSKKPSMIVQPNKKEQI
jgi:hypothetical protein